MLASAKVSIWIGLGVFVAGIVLTSVGFAAAATSGGSYLALWGAIVFGPLQVVRGVISIRRSNAELLAILLANAQLVKIANDQAAYAHYLKQMGANR
ncbi:hypothetical protein QN357_01845 [Cryobacterium sp. RTC2.1]|uniref:hypothetical protein n=1 Tax=Cryobacterium sp. RTC2.1 TaxID=3048634 RepID=UPI002B22802F|nr:hypothetical protein [Cryobacterium sp. RTC2.1]MEB0001680.1 hypothetical protein [Cryobacterium sp. RTC2.1]